MASSADYGKSKFNLAAQGHRQPGSAFKIMALMTALRKGVDPKSTSYVSKPLKFNDPAVGPDRDQDLRRLLRRLDEPRAGDAQVRQHRLHAARARPRPAGGQADRLRHGHPARKLDGYPAESLGGLTLGVSPLEMANAFATIASGGYRNRPTAITKITFPDGKSDLPRRFKVKRTKAFEDGVTAEATRILEKNIQGGTGTKANIGCPAAGKTGTTDEFNDAWFVGFTPRLATATWVGYPDAQVQMKTEYHGGSVAGGTFPAEIWGDYMKAVKGKFCGDFKPPKTPFSSIALLRQVLAQRRPRHRRLRRPAVARRRSSRAPTHAGRAPRTTDKPRQRRRQQRRTATATDKGRSNGTSTRTSTSRRRRTRPPTPGQATTPAAGPRRPPVEPAREPWYKPAVGPPIGRFQHAGRQCPAAPPRA